jgi:hypothetical protein
MRRGGALRWWGVVAGVVGVGASLEVGQVRAQEVDIMDGFLRESQCVAWREDGAGRAEVGR